MKRILALADIHAGSLYGLTPPKWQVNKLRFPKLYKLQQEMWDSYISILKKVGKVDVAIVDGDMIDGKGFKSGGCEQITTDLIEQCDIACEVLSCIKCDKMLMTYGTGYHCVSGSGEDMDLLIARKLGATIESHLFLDIEGVIFDVKHHVDGSSIPQGRYTAIAKSKMWNDLSALRKTAPHSNVILRAHTHHYALCGGSGWLASILPCLQAGGTRYGSRKCESSGIDWGMVKFAVDKGKLIGFEEHIQTLEHGKATVLKV